MIINDNYVKSGPFQNINHIRRRAYVTIAANDVVWMKSSALKIAMKDLIPKWDKTNNRHGQEFKED